MKNLVKISFLFCLIGLISCEKDKEIISDYIPEITTVEASLIGAKSAYSGVKNVKPKNTSLRVGLCWSTKYEPTVKDSYVYIYGQDSSKVQIYGLTPKTKYYVRAFIQNNTQTAYGNEISFTTLDYSTPTIQTLAATNVGNDVATLNGLLSDDGGYYVTSQGFYYGTNSDPKKGTKVIAYGSPNFSYALTGLTKNTKYYYCTFAVNQKGTTYGEVKEFTTTNVDKYIKVQNVSGTWEACTTKTKTGYNVIQSAGSYHVNYGYDLIKVTFFGFSTFNFYYGSYAEGYNDYVVVGGLDVNKSSWTYSNPTGYVYTSSGYQSSSAPNRSGSFVNDGKEHFFYVMYKKDYKYNYNDDRGYLALPNDVSITWVK